jgi:hypothetical protein
MKMAKKFWLGACVALALQTQTTVAQKIDDERMKRDIEVAENVLSTLIKQEVNQQRGGFFGIDVKGAYLPGYGVTFRLPMDMSMPYMIPSAPLPPGEDVIFSREGNSYVISSGGRDEEEQEAMIAAEREMAESDNPDSKAYRLKDKAKQKRKVNADSLRESYNLKMIKAAKDFIVDYGDFISQLGPNEKIIITNQGENRMWYFNSGKRSHISVEAAKADITGFKQGKLTRDQALAKIKVINTESVDVKEPDMELMTTIFNRLYRSDLSKTYFTDDNIYYERLRDYGVVYYMQVYSSNQSAYNTVSMPTIGLEQVDKATRDKKVVELFPKFEQELKENILEYGRTLKSLKDDESLIFNITMTKCKGCNIPSTIEVSVKSGVLKDYGAGKIEKNSALGKFTVKKGPNQ